MGILDLIDLRSFSNIWFWLVLALIWTRVIHAPLGVPIDLLRRALRGDPQAEADVSALAEIEIRERLALWDSFGALRTALWAFSLTALGLLGFLYGLEFAQALFILALPLGIAALLITRTVRQLTETPHDLTSACKRMIRLKHQVQGVGLIAVFSASIWGMFFNLAHATF